MWQDVNKTQEQTPESWNNILGKGFKTQNKCIVSFFFLDSNMGFYI